MPIMLSLRSPILFVIVTSLCFGPDLAVSQQATPVRPPSDSSTAPPDTSGTNYLRLDVQSQTALRQKLERLKVERMVNPQPSTVGNHIVRPTSDASSQSSDERLDSLLMQINPAAAEPKLLVAYTNYFVVRPNVEPRSYNTTAPSGIGPSVIRKLYNVPDNGGSSVIAIVDAFHYPNAAIDLNLFSQTYNLPPMPACPQTNPFNADGPCLRIEANPSAPVNCGWNGEAALDLEWAHSLAPNAKLLYVEAASAQNSDLYAAVAKARDEVVAFHGELSLSWGTKSEDSNTLRFASIFTAGVLYFAATGDVGGQVGFPAAFPGVISVGGTIPLLERDGTLNTEIGWPNSGGGVSALVAFPVFQRGVENMNPAGRNIPDIAAIASPDSAPGVSVYISTDPNQCQDHPAPDQYLSGWTTLIGTSLATPIVAAMVNVAGQGRTDVTDELQALYANRRDSARIRDIRLMSGSAGSNVTKVGYDNVTGVGVPVSLQFDAVPRH